MYMFILALVFLHTYTSASLFVISYFTHASDAFILSYLRGLYLYIDVCEIFYLFYQKIYVLCYRTYDARVGL